MNFIIKKSVLWFYLFFIIYLITYIGENTNDKYFGIVVFQLYLLLNYKKFALRKLDVKLSLLITIITLCLIISLVVNYNFSGAIKTFSLIDLFVLTYFMLARGAINLKIHEIKLISIIANSLFIVLLIAFVTHYNDVTIPLGRSTGAAVRHRFGFGAESIVGFLSFVEFTLTFYLANQEKRNKKYFYFLMIGMMLSLYMAYLADIRASLVSMIFFVIMFYYNKLPRTKGIIISKFLLILFFSVFVLFFASSTSLDMNTLNYLLSSRFVYYERAIKEVINNNAVLFGIGSFRNSEVFDVRRVQVDNSFLDVFYQYGIICLSLFIILLVKLSLELRKINTKFNKYDNTNSKYNHFINAYFISVLLYSMGEKNLFSLSSALSLVTFLLVFSYVEKYRKIESSNN